MLLEQWLCLDTVEIANSVRTRAYLKAGLGGPSFSIPSAGCDCDAYDEGPYVSPAADSAPWYESTRQESGEFLGLLLSAELLSVANRTVSVNGPRGAALGPLQLRQRVLSCSALMCAGSQRGMAWGERWLAEALAGDCGELGAATVLPVCPPTDDEDRYFRTLERVGLTDGPTFAPASNAKPCFLQSVTFQLAAEIPELLAPPTVLVDAETVTDEGSTSATASTAAWLGDAAVRITINPSTALSGWTIRAIPLAEGQTCPLPAGANPCTAYRLPALPKGNVLVIDPVLREVREFNVTSKRWVSGFGRLEFDGVFDWIEVPPCSNLCIEVASDAGTAEVTIEQIDREL